MTGGPKPKPLAELFWPKVDVGGPDDCWPWNRYVTPQGYAFFRYTVDSQYVGKPVHRVAYELAVGPIPDGLVIDHLCRNRACCNPAHLEPVTPSENVRRTQFCRECGRTLRKVAS